MAINVFLPCSLTKLADSMIAGLNGTELYTSVGNRCSDNFTLARSCDAQGRDIYVTLIESMNGVDTPCYSIYVADNVTGADCQLYDTKGLTKEALVEQLSNILANGFAVVEQPNQLKSDPYKVSQLEIMLAHETSDDEAHYGAHLTHWLGDAKPLTIDAGGLRALIAYYQTHETDMD